MPRTEKTKSNGKDKNAYRYQKKGNGKNDTGRPLIEATEQDCVIAETMAKLGGTNEEICATLDISIDTMKAWELRDKEFSVAINSGRDYHSNMEIKRSLRDRAKGYNWQENSTETIELECEKIDKLGATVRDDKGRKVKVKVPAVKTKTTNRHVPADPACIFFWLTNKRKEEFSHVRVNRIEGEVKGAPVTNNYYWNDIPEAELEGLLDTLQSAVAKKRDATERSKGNGASGTA